MKDNNLYTITEYGNGKAYMIKKNKYNPLNNRTSLYMPIKKIRNLENPYMTIRQYKSTLRRKQKELYNYDIDPSKCLYLTLTTPTAYDWVSLNKKFKCFIRTIDRNFKNTKYIRGIELFESAEPYFHIHLLLIFNESIPTKLTAKWISKYWNGITKLKTLDDYYSFVDYITLFDTNAIKDKDTKPKNELVYTKFPQWVKIISNSRNLPQIKKFQYEDDQQGINKLYEEFNKKHIEQYNKECFRNINKHYYIDMKTGEYCEVIDKEYLH